MKVFIRLGKTPKQLAGLPKLYIFRVGIAPLKDNTFVGEA